MTQGHSVTQFPIHSLLTLSRRSFYRSLGHPFVSGHLKNKLLSFPPNLTVSTILNSILASFLTASVVPSSPILVNLMKEALSSPKRRFLQAPHGVTSQKTPFLHYIHFGMWDITPKVDFSHFYSQHFLCCYVLLGTLY
jgi:hypothetical protein